jgi:hypothetical protein
VLSSRTEVGETGLEVLGQEQAEVILSCEQAPQRVVHVLPRIQVELVACGDDGERRCALTSCRTNIHV